MSEYILEYILAVVKTYTVQLATNPGNNKFYLPSWIYVGPLDLSCS
jgi:hypothetical protein